MNGTTYKNRELFEVACNDALKLTLCGIWYRASPMEWAVFDEAIKIVHRSENYTTALAIFNQLVADREVTA